MHPVLQSVQNNNGSIPRRLREVTPTPPQYPSQKASHLPEENSNDASSVYPDSTEKQGTEDNIVPSCGIASGAGIDNFRVLSRDINRRALVPETNLFKSSTDVVPQNDYEREHMYKAGTAISVNPNRVLKPDDFNGEAPDFNPAINHIKAANLKTAANQTARQEELRNICHQSRLRTALTRLEIKAGLYYLYDFVATYVENPDGRVALNPQLVLVAQHAGNSMLAERIWSIADDKNTWLRELIEMAYMIINDPTLTTDQQLSAICTTVIELSMKYAKLVAKNGYPSMVQLAKTQEFFYRIMEAILNLGVELGVYNNRPLRYRRSRISEIPQMTDADYMFGLTQALESRPISEFDGYEDDLEQDDEYY
ncbi:encapsidation protein 52K [Crane-associated adenovirus 1]|uniref:Encapsidation protein 52K n=1 Tax=Crane-associated adenovirus 1 TaxID=2559941 RepID=A0A5H2X2P0_9ADEN|nr:encapsidation protein 52K [Crane-associated adenovirus 1]